MSSYESITSQEYHLFSVHSIIPAVFVENCGLDLYRDSFILGISNFTIDKNGYYWCQLVINNTYTQPSHRAWFYAAAICDPSSAFLYFRPASLNETQCAEFTAPSTSSQIASFTPSTSQANLSGTSTTLIPTSTTSSTAIQKNIK